MTETLAMGDVLRLVKGAKKAGDGWIARCPAHDDRNPSLSISQGKDGRILFHCHANCALDAITGALGISVAQLFAPQTRNGDKIGYHRAAIHEYHDAAGKVVFFRDRFEWFENGKPDKKCFPRQPDGTCKGNNPVPYQLPALLKGIQASAIIIIVEGEKAADALHAHGYIATTTGGSDSWSPKFAEHFRGARAVLWPDADEPGEKYIANVARDLAGIAADVRVVRFDGKGDGWDAADYFGEGETEEQLDHLLEDAPAYNANLPIAKTLSDELPNATCALTAPPPDEMSWAIEELFLVGEPGLLFGDSGTMKSTTALVLACAKAGGYRAFGHFSAAPAGPVLIVSAEDSAAVIQSRIRAICRGHGWDERRVLANVHYYAMAGVSLKDPRWCAKLESEALRLNVALIVLDPMQELVEGDQNSASEMGPYIKFMRRLAMATNAVVLLVHHATKATEGKRLIDRVRGSTAIYNAMRAAYYISGADDGMIGVECVKLSRAEKLKPFAVRYVIESDVENRFNWTLARFDYVSARQAAFDKAQTFILARLDESGRLTTTDLKEAAKGSGVSAIEIAKALKSLSTLAVIDFEPGEKNAKLWGRKELVLAKRTEQPDKQTDFCLPGNQNGCRATTPQDAGWLPTPLGGNQPGKVEAVA